MTAAHIVQAAVAAHLEQAGQRPTAEAVARLLGVAPQGWRRYLRPEAPSPTEATIRGWLQAAAEAGVHVTVTIRP